MKMVADILGSIGAFESCHDHSNTSRARDATLAVHEGLLKDLNQDEVMGVIGRELGHIRHRDFLIMTSLSSLPLIAYLIFRETSEASWVGGRASNECMSLSGLFCCERLTTRWRLASTQASGFTLVSKLKNKIGGKPKRNS